MNSNVSLAGNVPDAQGTAPVKPRSRQGQTRGGDAMNSRSQAESRASDQRTAHAATETGGSSDHGAVEPSPFACPDQNRAKQGKALLGLSAMLAISLSFYAYHHIDALIARASVGHHAHYAPAEDSSLHEVR
jgi:hypothetical protein